MSKREIVEVNNRIDFYINDIKSARNYLEGRFVELASQPIQNENIMKEQQEIQGHLQRLTTGQKNLNEILFSVQNITGHYREFYRNQAIERNLNLYSETLPQLEEYAKQTDNILSNILSDERISTHILQIVVGRQINREQFFFLSTYSCNNFYYNMRFDFTLLFIN